MTRATELAVYHATTAHRALVIDTDGFSDDYEEVGLVGVQVCDGPVDVGDGFPGSELIRVPVPAAMLVGFEITEEGKPEGCLREWIVPAGVLNAFGPVWVDQVTLEPVDESKRVWARLLSGE